MDTIASRRGFLTAGLGLPALAAAQSEKPVGMDRRTLGKTGLKVAPLGFGGRGTTEAGVLRRAFDLGINYFDTGRMYANNERLIGVALKEQRKNVIIAGKTAAKTKQDALADLDASLRDLQSDYIDIWQLHGKVDPKDVTDELLGVLQDAKKSGKVRFVGITSHLNVPVMLAHMLKVGGCDVVLTGYNFTFQPEVTEAIRAARRAGMGIVAMKVLAGGFSRIENSAPRFEGSPRGAQQDAEAGRGHDGRHPLGAAQRIGGHFGCLHGGLRPGGSECAGALAAVLSERREVAGGEAGVSCARSTAACAARAAGSATKACRWPIRCVFLPTRKATATSRWPGRASSSWTNRPGRFAAPIAGRARCVARTGWRFALV